MIIYRNVFFVFGDVINFANFKKSLYKHQQGVKLKNSYSYGELI